MSINRRDLRIPIAHVQGYDKITDAELRTMKEELLPILGLHHIECPMCQDENGECSLPHDEAGRTWVEAQ